MPDSDPTMHPSSRPSGSDSGLGGLNPLALMDGVLGGRSTDWEPPAPESLESSFPGYSNFVFLDRGGMGAVYAATQASLGRRVAVKILPPELLDDEGFMDRFRLEASLLARLQHPHIVAVYDFGITQDGHHYIVMEYVEGVSLQEILRRDSITAGRALTIAAQVCEALHYAHERGVIHRDIKPSNILIDERGLVRVADFGLAKSSQDEDLNKSGEQRTKAFMGTLGYAAPEQHDKSGVMDRRSDIYSLGVTLYEMLTGKLPVGVFDPPSKLAGTPAHLDKIIHRALKQRPEDRYETAQQMRQAIATSLLRMGTPLVQRAIISKPITSMVTCVIVGMGLIYLIDALNNKLIIEPRMRAQAKLSRERQTVASRDTYGVIHLSHEWAVLNRRLRWDEVLSAVDLMPDWEFAEIHNEAEQREVVERLKSRGYEWPLWLAAQCPEDQAGQSYTWLSGRPMDYQPWIGASGSPIIITEVQAKNDSTYAMHLGSPDWIELMNVGSTPVDLRGYSLRYYRQEAFGRVLAQDWLEAGRFTPPNSPVLAPGERRVILCVSRGPMDTSHAYFRFSLEASHGGIFFSDPRGHAHQRFDVPWKGFPADSSLALAPDGKSWGWTDKPTPGAENGPIGESFPSPTNGSAEKMGLMMHPAFERRWTGNPKQFAKPALLRRKRS